MQILGLKPRKQMISYQFGNQSIFFSGLSGLIRHLLPNIGASCHSEGKIVYAVDKDYFMATNFQRD